jgi:hypothetical protein
VMASSDAHSTGDTSPQPVPPGSPDQVTGGRPFGHPRLRRAEGFIGITWGSATPLAEPEQSEEAAIPDGKRVSFREFELFYRTTEWVTNNRLAANRWNYSVCVALVVGIAVLVKFTSDKTAFVIVGPAGIVTLCVIGVLFCRYWRAEIDTAKNLNNAKFSVLNEMAEKLAFRDEEQEVYAQSYQPFVREWRRLESEKKATKVRALGNLTVLSSSKQEVLMPTTFLALFVVIAFSTPAIVVASWRVPSIRPYLPTAPVTTSPSVKVGPSTASSAKPNPVSSVSTTP